MGKVIDWLVSLFGPDAVAWFFTIALVVWGGWAGWTVNGWRWEYRNAVLEKNHAKETSVRDRAVLDAIKEVRALEQQGNEIAAQLIAAEAARSKLAKERDDAIKKLTTGRACLAAPVVRLLNDSSVNSGAGFRLPSTPGNSANSDSAFATDTDVGLWAANARDAHDACRARIDAIRNFYDLMEPE